MRAPLLFAVTIGVISCTEALPPDPPRPVLAALRTHDAKVSIVGGRGGDDLRVVVKKDDGTVLADAVTLDELRAKDPETWQVVTSALARKDGTYVDATYTAPPDPKPL